MNIFLQEALCIMKYDGTDLLVNAWAKSGEAEKESEKKPAFT